MASGYSRPEAVSRVRQRIATEPDIQTGYEVNRASAYAALSTELESCRRLPPRLLVGMISQKSAAKVVVVDGEELVLEVQAVWASPKKVSVRVSAIAYGPSHLQTERLEEHLTISVSDAGSSR